MKGASTVQDRPDPGLRISVIGTTGSGKTTFAHALAHRLDLPHVELDALHWGPDWTMTPTDEFRARVAAALSAERWVTDGNYSKARDVIWSRAQTLVWPDYPLRIAFWRLLRRTLRRTITREELWNGNRETWRGAFLSRDSLLFYQLSTYHRRRRDYPVLVTQPEYAHLTLVRLRSPREADRWLARV